MIRELLNAIGVTIGPGITIEDPMVVALTFAVIMGLVAAVCVHQTEQDEKRREERRTNEE